MSNKHLCAKCNNIAVYWPGFIINNNPFFCEDCVPRNCESNYRYVDVNAYYPALDKPDLPNEKDYPIKWIKKDKIWCKVDEKGRQYPCCEYDYSQHGYDINLD